MSVWLNKVFAAFPQAIDLQMHDVPDGDHTDLYVTVSK